MGRPPVVDQQVEHAQQEHQERRAPPCLESHSDHDASAESKDGHEHSEQCPLSCENEAEEEEDQEDSSCQLKVDSLVRLADVGQTGENVLLLGEGVTEYHQ